LRIESERGEGTRVELSYDLTKQSLQMEQAAVK